METPTITDAMKNYLAVRTAACLTEDAAEGERTSPQLLQTMARTFLAAVNRVPLPHGFEQPPDVPKRTKYFGRTLLAAPGFYVAVRELVSAESSAVDKVVGHTQLHQREVERSELLAFVDDFERTFKDGVVEQSDVTLGQLVWVADFADASRNRGRERMRQAAEAASAAAQDGDRAKSELSDLVHHGLELGGEAASLA
ncbi:hypothetical protein AB1Y20_000310 [Prymnesium parvum]|uniref:Uncharacterized protein n=1 Tax=Prymnesium parvum TaxID=97485 RepID=A0AB34K7U5_PRYPA